jgi:transposase-like protein
MKETIVGARRTFDKTFKREAVQNWLNSGKSAEAVGLELGISSRRLYTWKQSLAPAPGGGGPGAGAKPGSLAQLQSQLDCAQREIQHLRQQRDILKKTLGILSEPSPSALKGSTR